MANYLGFPIGNRDSKKRGLGIERRRKARSLTTVHISKRRLRSPKWKILGR